MERYVKLSLIQKKNLSIIIFFSAVKITASIIYDHLDGTKKEEDGYIRAPLRSIIVQLILERDDDSPYFHAFIETLCDHFINSHLYRNSFINFLKNRIEKKKVIREKWAKMILMNLGQFGNLFVHIKMLQVGVRENMNIVLYNFLSKSIF